MTVGIASDHAGFPLKEILVEFVRSLGHHVLDMGTHSPAPVDYPLLIAPLARRVAEGHLDRGIALCGSDIGASIVANKVPGVRCALCHEPLSASLARRHNDANVLAMGARLVGPEMAKEVVRVWLATEFEGGRHQARLRQVHELESAP